MRLTYRIVIFFLLVNSGILMAQNMNRQQEYLNAKEFFNEGKYSLAMESFKPIINTNKANPFSSYASYYYALSAYHADYPALSRDMLLQIKQLYSNWDKMDEVNLWLSKLYFEEHKINRAIAIGNEVTRLTSEVEQQAAHYLTQIDSLDELALLYSEFPDSKAVGKRYAQLINALPLVEQDRGMLDELAMKFDLNEDEFNITTTLTSTKKDKYKVAVMFPFMLEDLRPSLSKKRNQFVIDLYQGMQKAIDDLSEDSIKVELITYDTKKSAVTTLNLVSEDEMKNMDLIIGPLYPGPSHQASDFSFRNKINMLNPLSSNPDVIGNNPFSFLYKPSDVSEGNAAAEYVVNNIENKNTMIFYGGSKRDSIKAHVFKSKVEQDSFQVVLMKKVEQDTSRLVLQLLTATLEDIEETFDEGLSDEEKVQLVIAADSIGSIYVASENKLLASSVVSAIEIRSDTIQVIGSSDWLQYRFIDYDAYERLGIVLTAPNYIDTSTPIYRDINNYFVQKYGKPASEHHLIGYDAMMFIGKALYEHGKYFQNGLNEMTFTEAALSYGFNYQHANDNQLVPIIYFNDNRLKIVPPSTTNVVSKNE